MRSKGGVKPAIPCLTDPVDKLEGLGGKTRRNLLDVRTCVRNIDGRVLVPHDAPNEITTGDLCCCFCNQACTACRLIMLTVQHLHAVGFCFGWKW